MIDTTAEFIADLLGCTEDDAECLAKARKYATWLILVIIIAVLLFVAPKLYHLVKGKEK